MFHGRRNIFKYLNTHSGTLTDKPRQLRARIAYSTQLENLQMRSPHTTENLNITSSLISKFWLVAVYLWRYIERSKHLSLPYDTWSRAQCARIWNEICNASERWCSTLQCLVKTWVKKQPLQHFKSTIYNLVTKSSLFFKHASSRRRASTTTSEFSLENLSWMRETATLALENVVILVSILPLRNLFLLNLVYAIEKYVPVSVFYFRVSCLIWKSMHLLLYYFVISYRVLTQNPTCWKTAFDNERRKRWIKYLSLKYGVGSNVCQDFMRCEKMFTSKTAHARQIMQHRMQFA